MDIFNISTEEDFTQACLETFRYQYQNIEIYKKFVDYLNIQPSQIDNVEDIPFLPIEMFKNHRIIDQNKEAHFYFQSSGTTQMNLSKHWICDPKIYEESLYKSFEQFIGRPEDFVFLGLLPNYLERQNSSLVYMVDYLMKISSQPENGYFLYNHEDLLKQIQHLEQEQKKYIVFGVSFALLDFMDTLNQLNIKDFKIPNGIVIETGGMKGRKEEMTKDQLLQELQTGFGTEKIYSEYSMTELLSQAYSKGQNEYETPNWMRILIRNTEDPFSYVEEGRTGAINIIDLANKHSCAFIATQDLGRFDFDSDGNRKFQVLGRIDHSDIRGCSLLVS
ncbi:acyl transferase [Elizabethkingia meningoseptica]|uniref:LuxE/PaaK family acyltransferase n=1 Tax=Elizabethkingia meningoseptica TaxID=238 RepID=UPI0008419D05|nr:acyl transferase [Elizabethkingia meningoseptica]ODM52700.1 acyl transferase [Elizabethkingia meningoseptica]OHT27611.1 acyl transferase [Elizabethkingia meningoseptica]OPC09113.1 acyl transferase [Elizabethkingia meningoseptica]OPC23593.1 acyl transferase [Elizabethkingia meningoseptica]